MRHAPCRSRRAAALAVAAVTVLALSGCGSGEDGAPEQGSRPVGGDGSPGASAPTGATTGAAGDAGRATDTPRTGDVELLDAGSGPRRLLELDVEKGHVERTTTSIEVTMDVGPERMTLPLSMPFTTTVTDVGTDGFTADVVYGRASVAGGDMPEGAEPVVDEAMALIEGTTAHVAYGRDGILRSSRLELGDAAPDLVARMLDNITSQSFAVAVPYPAEEVGVGARWRADTTLQIAGAESVVTSTYEIVELTADGYVLEVAAEQVTEPGPALGGGTIVESVSNGSGTVTGRTGLVSPARAVTDMEGRSTVDVGGQEVTTTFAGTMTMTTR